MQLDSHTQLAPEWDSGLIALHLRQPAAGARLYRFDHMLQSRR